MKNYTSKSGKKSGVIAYEIGIDYIIVRFERNDYKYTVELNSQEIIDEMKCLAEKPEGLSTYISRNRNYLEFV